MGIKLNNPLNILLLLVATTSTLPAQSADQMMKSWAQSFQGENADPAVMDSFSRKIRTIAINEDSADDVRSKIGPPSYGKIKMGGMETWTYMPQMGIMAYVQFDESGKVSGVRVSRGGGPNMEEIYCKGEVQMFPGSRPKTSSQSKDKVLKTEAGLSQLATNSSAPIQAVPGQIYFNTLDKHVYFYNGTEWLQLDNPKNP